MKLLLILYLEIPLTADMAEGVVDADAGAEEVGVRDSLDSKDFEVK